MDFRGLHINLTGLAELVMALATLVGVWKTGSKVKERKNAKRKSRDAA